MRESSATGNVSLSVFISLSGPPFSEVVITCLSNPRRLPAAVQRRGIFHFCVVRVFCLSLCSDWRLESRQNPQAGMPAPRVNVWATALAHSSAPRACQRSSSCDLICGADGDEAEAVVYGTANAVDQTDLDLEGSNGCDRILRRVCCKEIF